jgi:hypothetical protein
MNVRVITAMGVVIVLIFVMHNGWPPHYGAALVSAQRGSITRPCTIATLNGTYSFFRSGTTTQGPLAAVGTIEYDGRGFFKLTQTTSRNGNFTEGGFDGPYEINANCTGRWLTPDRQGMVGYFAIADGGNEYYFLSTTTGNTVTGIAKRTRSSTP